VGQLRFSKFLSRSFFLVFAGIGAMWFVKNKPYLALNTEHRGEEAVYQVAQEVSSEDGKKDPTQEIDRVKQLFSKGPDKLPIVETVTYSSRVPWLKGRPAWLADYASYFNTSRHFIARSLNGKNDYVSQKVSIGDRFNVFKKNLSLEFHLKINLSTAKMQLFYKNLDSGEEVLLKTYPVGLGRVDPNSPSGCLTPVGKFKLGGKVAIYTPGVTGFFQNRKIEMMEVFGTRWLPFDEEIEGCSDAAKGYGIHGVPCHYDAATGAINEEKTLIGDYSSDGCIRMAKEHVEELFSVVITKPTIVEITRGTTE
jgi:lipoprotein-anchoring transpeptidase ErfK/SrfK